MQQQPSAGAPRVASNTPVTSAEVARAQPAGTLQQDAFDAANATTVSEARKAGGGGGHEGHGSAGGASEETIYTCPMHPEVTSAKPGECPKCGMALVKTEK